MIDDNLSRLLVGLEMSAVSMVRDYVEFLFDGPVVRALTDPRGRLDNRGWQFPVGDALSIMRKYISRTITSVDFREDDHLTLRFDDDWIVVPLGVESRRPFGSEAAHVVAADDLGRPDATEGMWVF